MLVVVQCIPVMCVQEGESRALYTLGSVFHALGKNMVEQSRREEESKVTLRKAVQYYR